jgi:hypothetical protein
MKKDLILLGASLLAPVMANAELYDNVGDEIPAVYIDVEDWITSPEEYFVDMAPWEYLPDQFATVLDLSSPCNVDGESFLEFIAQFNADEEFRYQRILCTNYSLGDTLDEKLRYFDFTVPYYEENGIVPIIATPPAIEKDVENFATFFAVDANRVGYQVVLSKEDNFMMAILGFVRYAGRWYCTASNVFFLDYDQQ